MFARSSLFRAAVAKHPSIRTSIYPSRYVQGPNAIELLGEELKRLGKRALILQDPFVASTMAGDVQASIKGKIDAHIEVFKGECCDEEINRLAAIKDIDVICSIGGGKTLDTGKAVAYTRKLPVAIAPTLAATDAPCTALVVVYKSNSDFDRYIFLPQNPNLVLVDSTVISKAPVRFLVAGMGDALATYFEAESCVNMCSGNLTGYMGSFTSFGIARMCYETLLEFGPQAKAACEAHAPCTALERVIEANVLLSGLGAESGGLAAAHAIHNGLTSLPETHAFWHGEKVAVGLEASLFLTDKPAGVVDTVFSFCEKVGLPTTLADIGIKNATPEKLLQVAKLSCAPEDTMPKEAGIITPEAVVYAMRAADEYGRKHKAH